jgi:hypothetical protein
LKFRENHRNFQFVIHENTGSKMYCQKSYVIATVVFLKIILVGFYSLTCVEHSGAVHRARTIHVNHDCTSRNYHDYTVAKEESDTHHYHDCTVGEEASNTHHYHDCTVGKEGSDIHYHGCIVGSAGIDSHHNFICTVVVYPR